MYALIDCNNFFVSCERIFRLDLYNKPVVVMSSNDGCFISRSNEAKLLGIPMGAPYFKYKDLIIKHDIQVFSANFELYKNISMRIMSILQTFDHNLEVYSIDEAFVQLPSNNISDLIDQATSIKATIKQYTSVDVSIGISTTKTLAKLANKFAKQHLGKQSFPEGIYFISNIFDEEDSLTSISNDSIWGIGKNNSIKLNTYNIFSIIDFVNARYPLIKKLLGILGARTYLELHGKPCITTSHNSIRKSILQSRTLAKQTSDYQYIYNVFANFINNLSQTLRKESLVASEFTIFINTSRYDNNYYTNSHTITLPQPTSYPPTFFDQLDIGLQQIFRPNLPYKRLGIMLSGLRLVQLEQYQLLESDQYNNNKKSNLMQIVDGLNSKYNNNCIDFACAYQKPNLISNSKNKSPDYLTNWDDLPVVYISES
jgi:DNA polymerase V